MAKNNTQEQEIIDNKIKEEIHYKATVASSSRELDFKQRLAIKDTSNAIDIVGQILENDAPIIIDVDFTAVIHIENSASENTEYDVYIVADKDGQYYKTSSDSFMKSLSDIQDEIEAEGYTDPWSIKCYLVKSKNYTKSNGFLTCSII